MNWLRKSRMWMAVALLLVGAACVNAPELDEVVPRGLRKIPYPEIVPLDDTRLAAQLPQEQSEEIQQTLAARRDRLKARIARLNRPEVDDPTR